MANNDNSRSLSKINKRLNNLSVSMDRLYQSTYKSRVDNRRDMDSIIGSIDDNLDTILSQVNGQNISDISSLYIRLQEKGSDKKSDVVKSIESLFDNNQNIIDSINMDSIHKSIQSENYQYDLICKYMTKLEDAIEIKKDNVLSSDNFTKDFINVLANKSNKQEIDRFNDRATLIKEKYNVQDLFDEMEYKASKYGEFFLYLVPYKKALERLLQRKEKLSLGIKYESTQVTVSEVTVFESASFDIVEKNSPLSELDNKFRETVKDGDMSVNIIFDDTGIIAQPIEHVEQIIQARLQNKSLTEAFTESVIGETGDIVKDVKEGTLLFDDPLSTDGYISSTGSNSDIKLTDKINGSVVFEIPREDILPLYLSDQPIGYLYMQVDNTYIDKLVLNGKTYNSLTNNTTLSAEEFDVQNDMLISHIATSMAEKINAKFINSNLDLKEQIYSILRYNDKFCSTHGKNNITVTFLPIEDVHHFYHKLNKKTHRGISDLENSLIPAMIYCLLYLSTTIGTVSRSQDKRVYYVKQNVETNVAKTLLNVINQLKKGNMGMRQLESMNTIFNVVGKYNDHIIPMSQSGEPPISMEVLQGQSIDTPTELMDKMEDAAVTATEVPLEFVQSVNQVDFATRFTMTNSKFLRKIYKRQRLCQNEFSKIFLKLYNFEFNENKTIIKILLPAPSFLSMTNGQQLINNIKEYVATIADITCTDVDEEVRNEFINICTRKYLGTYIDFSNIDDLITEAKMIVQCKKEAVTDDSGDSDSMY